MQEPNSIFSDVPRCKAQDSSHEDFFTLVSDVALNAEATSQPWSRDELKHLFHDRVLCGIGQKALRFHLRRQFLKAGLTGGEQVTIEFVESVIYRYLSTATAGVDFNKAMQLAEKAQLDEILSSKVLGGKRSWDAATFIAEDVWDTCGGQGGLQAVAKNQLGTIGDHWGPLGTIGDHWGCYGMLGTVGDRWGRGGAAAGTFRNIYIRYICMVNVSYSAFCW